MVYVAGVISTFPPHDREHPDRCIPIAIAVVDALGDWTPDA